MPTNSMNNTKSLWQVNITNSDGQVIEEITFEFRKEAEFFAQQYNKDPEPNTQAQSPQETNY